jgi:hypothetical protein
MYQFSRSIYRELAPLVLDEKHSSQKESNQEIVLRQCESAIERLVTDRRYFARPARTLFADIRPYFSISDLGRVCAITERNVEVAVRFLDQMPHAALGAYGAIRTCQATTRKGTPCRRQPLVASEYCPSHQHLTETFDDLHLQQGELEHLELEQIELAA